MSELSQQIENSWLMIPFWTNPNSPEYAKQIRKFGDFALRAKEVSGLKLAVIDDGCGVTPKDIHNTPDLFVSLSSNQGKAQAIRDGLKALLGQKEKPDFIVQYDGDGDQIPEDIPSVYKTLLKESDRNPENPTLVIGNRYSEGLRTAPNPDSVAYRQTLLILFGAISKQLTGAENVRDWVSGARGYTSSYAEGFLQRSKANRYGVESEQLIIAGLMGAKVASARLTDSRPRDPWTLTNKWQQNFEIYAQHAGDLIDQGLGNVVSFVEDLMEGLGQDNEFSLDLSSLGVDTNIRLWKWDSERHAAEIPLEDRSKVFETDSNFPFTLRKSIASVV